MLGASEYVADALAKSLINMGNTVTIHNTPTLEDVKDEPNWIVCTSTHGAGELPDNIKPFAKALETADLSKVNAFIIGLGDTSYDTYCFGALMMENLLKSRGATLEASAHLIDVLEHPIPEDEAVMWFERMLETA